GRGARRGAAGRRERGLGERIDGGWGGAGIRGRDRAGRRLLFVPDRPVQEAPRVGAARPAAVPPRFGAGACGGSIGIDCGPGRLRRSAPRVVERDVDVLDVFRERVRGARLDLVDHVYRLGGARLRAQPEALADSIDELETREVVEQTVSIAQVDVVADLSAGDDRAFRPAGRLDAELVEAERGADA